MSDIQITLTGDDKLQQGFAKAPRLMRIALVKATNKAVLTIGRRAAQNAPVDTGNLRASILDPSRGLVLANDSMFAASVGSGTGYGGFVESGTRFQRAQPYLGPAVNSSEAEVNQFFTDAVDSVMSDIVR